MLYLGRLKSMFITLLLNPLWSIMMNLLWCSDLSIFIDFWNYRGLCFCCRIINLMVHTKFSKIKDTLLIQWAVDHALKNFFFLWIANSNYLKYEEFFAQSLKQNFSLLIIIKKWNPLNWQNVGSRKEGYSFKWLTYYCWKFFSGN